MAEFDRMNGNAASSAVAPAVAAMLREAEHWTQLQCEWLSGVETAWMHWADRHRARVDASTGALKEMTGCRTLGEVVQVQRRWFADAAQRGVADFGALAGDTVMLGQLAVGIARREEQRDGMRMPPTSTASHTVVEPAPAPEHRQAAE